MNDAQIRIWAWQQTGGDLAAAGALADWVITGSLPLAVERGGNLADERQQIGPISGGLANGLPLAGRDLLHHGPDDGLAPLGAEGDFGSSHANTSCAAVCTVSMEEGPASGEGPAPTARTAQEGAA
jgi:hypothetical protein